MGELFRINKTRIVVWPKDHNPIHVHVIVRAEEIEFKVFVDTLRVEHVTEKQMSARDEKQIVKFIGENVVEIREAWHEIQKDQQK